MLQNDICYIVWTWTGAFTGFQGKKEFIQRKLCVVVRVYASRGKVWDSEFSCLLPGKEGRVIGSGAACGVEILCYCISYGSWIIYCYVVYFEGCDWGIWSFVV